MTDTAANHSANSGARRSKIVEFHGEATSHPGWLYSVRLQALATNSDDVLDDFDNPYKRDRRTSDSTAPRNADGGEGEAFAEEGEEVALMKESVADFTKAKTSWTKRRNALFSDIAASLKGTTEGLARRVKTGDVQGLIKLIADNHGDSTEASRYALIMDLVILRLESVAQLDAHIASFHETERRTGTVYTFATMIRFVADSRYIDIKKELEDSIRTTHRKFDSRA